jgi:hypothetical protein
MASHIVATMMIHALPESLSASKLTTLRSATYIKNSTKDQSIITLKQVTFIAAANLSHLQSN